MADYQASKVLIYSGINDIPIAPSSTSGGKISHFYNLYNQFIPIKQLEPVGTSTGREDSVSYMQRSVPGQEEEETYAARTKPQHEGEGDLIISNLAKIQSIIQSV